jgi:membrane-bound metal-dependent hydrolase YbcI (DUF457 family)
MGIAHFAAGLAAKHVTPKIPLWILLVASETIDILWIIFALLGIESLQYAPWSHSLFMAVVWSIIAGLIAWRILHSQRSGIVIGAIVFSHWLLDFIAHPMGALGYDNKPDLPLFFSSTPLVGLGLYNSPAGAYVTEVGLFALGVGLYIWWLRKQKRAIKADSQNQPVLL